MNRRTEQVSSTIQRAIQDVLARGLNDPRVSGLITITEVRVSSDLREAVVMVSVLPEEKQELTLHGLKHAAPHIRREIGEAVRSRQLPTLIFKLDQSLKKQAAVIRAIARATESTGTEPPWRRSRHRASREVFVSDPAKRFAALIKRLKSEFEAPPETAAAMGPPVATSADSILEQLVYSFLLWETTTVQAAAAQKRLRDAFVDLNELRVCFPEEISAAVGERFPKSRERASRLRAALNDIYRREHGLSLARLVDQPKREARMYLESLEGMPVFVSGRVALLTLGCHTVPVDERLLALLMQERAVEADLSVEEASSWIERQVRANEAGPAHHLLRCWADEEGGSGKRERGKPAARAGAAEAVAAGETAEGKKAAPRKRSSKPKTPK